MPSKAMNLQSSFTYDNFGRRTSRTLQQDNTTVSTAGRSYDTFGRYDDKGQVTGANGSKINLYLK